MTCILVAFLSIILCFPGEKDKEKKNVLGMDDQLDWRHLKDVSRQLHPHLIYFSCMSLLSFLQQKPNSMDILDPKDQYSVVAEWE